MHEALKRITWTFAAVYSPATLFSCIASDAAVEAMKALTATPFRRRGGGGATAAAAATLESQSTPKKNKTTDAARISTPRTTTPTREPALQNPKAAHVGSEGFLPRPDEEARGGGGEREQAGGPGGGGEEAAEEVAARGLSLLLLRLW
uniref:Uncharacterized protein n=1 Tax=Oryza brachyantha TaxID=4533 RepID=J3KYM5_ORYBR